jgi:hypothetical protein
MLNRRVFAAQMLILLVPTFALACDFPFRPLSELYEKADAVFVGKVIESPWRQPSGSVVSTRSNVVRFAIERPIKGIQDKEITFLAAANSCSYAFLQGETYLVHSYRSNGRLETGQQNRPLLLANATEPLKYIDALLGGRPQGLLYVNFLLASGRQLLPLPATPNLILLSRGRWNTPANDSQSSSRCNGGCGSTGRVHRLAGT